MNINKKNDINIDLGSMYFSIFVYLFFQLNKNLVKSIIFFQKRQGKINETNLWWWGMGKEESE